MKSLIYTAVISPFDMYGSIDPQAFLKLCRIQFEQGIYGLVLGGTTGESPTVTSEELSILVNLAINLRDTLYPDRKIVVGCGTNSTTSTILKLSHILSKPDQLMIVLPYYNKPNYDGIYSHLESIILQQIAPLMIYHIPGRTGQKLTAIELANLCNSLLELYPGSIASIKESTGLISYAQELREILNPKIQILSGDDGLYLTTVIKDLTIYDGIVSVLSNIKCKELINFIDNPIFIDFINLSEIVKFLFSMTNPLPVKYYASKYLKIGSMKSRLPLELNKRVESTLDKNISATEYYLNDPFIYKIAAESLGNYIWIMPHHQILDNPEYIAIYCQLSFKKIDTIVSYTLTDNHIYQIRFFNQDGNEINVCGNGIRCIYYYILKTTGTDPILINNKGQIYPCVVNATNVAVDLGSPRLLSIIYDHNNSIFEKLNYLSSNFKGFVVDIGNPHLVIYVKELVDLQYLSKLGKICQTLYTDGINLELVKINNNNSVDIQIYERGVGISNSCGSGCVAAIFSGHTQMLLDHKVIINLSHGYMTVNCDKNNHYWTEASVDIE